MEKPRAYAEAGIPVCLLVDRDSREVTVHPVPDGVRHERTQTVPFGRQAVLPDPVGLTLDTPSRWCGGSADHVRCPTTARTDAGDTRFGAVSWIG
jgi:hypothetical protein